MFYLTLASIVVIFWLYSYAIYQLGYALGHLESTVQSCMQAFKIDEEELTKQEVESVEEDVR